MGFGICTVVPTWVLVHPWRDRRITCCNLSPQGEVWTVGSYIRTVHIMRTHTYQSSSSMLPRLEGPALLKVSSCEQYFLEVQGLLRWVTPQEVGPNPGKPCCSLGLTYLIRCADKSIEENLVLETNCVTHWCDQAPKTAPSSRNPLLLTCSLDEP
jgi:hypothetical protein